MKKIYKYLIILVISLVIGVFLCEMIVRIFWNLQIIKMDNLGVISYEFMRERSDPDLPYELKPNLDLISQPYHIVTNSDGFRDKEYAVKKPENTFRVLVLGDSITFGFGIRENADIYYNILEEMLNAYARKMGLDKKIEVIGIAAPGYDSYTELSILKKKGLKYKPDVVFFAYCLNDIRDAVYSCEFAKGLKLGYSKPSLIKMPSFLRRLLRKSVLYSYLAYSVNLFVSDMQARREVEILSKEKEMDNTKRNMLSQEKPEKTAPDESGPPLYFHEGSEWYHIYQNSHSGPYAKIVDNYVFNDLEKLAETYAFKVVFVIFPAFEKNPQYFPGGNRYVFEDAHRNLTEMLRGHAFGVLDLKPYLSGMRFQDVAMDDCHLSLNGHRKVAEVLYLYAKKNFID